MNTNDSISNILTQRREHLLRQAVEFAAELDTMAHLGSEGFHRVDIPLSQLRSAMLMDFLSHLKGLMGCTCHARHKGAAYEDALAAFVDCIREELSPELLKTLVDYLREAPWRRILRELQDCIPRVEQLMVDTRSFLSGSVQDNLRIPAADINDIPAHWAPPLHHIPWDRHQEHLYLLVKELYSLADQGYSLVQSTRQLTELLLPTDYYE